MTIHTAIEILLVVFSLAITAQSVFSIYLMLYTWADPRREEAIGSPKTYLPPRTRFSLLVPARHESAVIATTLRKISEVDYPAPLVELVVVCHRDDTETIFAAQQAIEEIKGFSARIVTFSGLPINKPRALNIGLETSTNDVIAVFDAEDDPHRDILKIADTIMQQEGPAIIQAGVQLMDVRSSWYAAHNVLEYFFWFRSRLHYHSKVGAVPLGGNTVFIRRDVLDSINGWDDNCLTEDADLGVRACAQGFSVSVTYDPRHVTREETPTTVASFVRQRTRWNQGFLQVFRKGDWFRLPTWRQRFLMGYTLAYPVLQSLMSIMWIPLILFVRHMSLPVAMLSYTPLYLLGLQLTLSLVGLAEFADAYQLRIRKRDFVYLTVGYIPYLVLLFFAALRALYRQIIGFNNWEKTLHQGAHRDLKSPPKETVLSGQSTLGEGVHRSEVEPVLAVEVAHEAH